MRIAIVTAALLTAMPAAAQIAPPLPQAARINSYDVLIRRIDHYVDPSKKPAIVAALQADRTRLLAIGDEAAFVKALNGVLLDASGDKHLSVFRKGPQPPEADREEANFGIAHAAIDGDGIGRLTLRGFSNHPDSRAAVDAAMAKLAPARALIVDLRDNGGGGEVSFRRLLGHFFARETAITAIEWRECAPPPADRLDACTHVAPRLERRATDQPAQPAFAAKPVYVLVSARSFSAAEAFAYELQAHARATVIGERTPGGGNPSAGMDLESELVVIMPIGRMRPAVGSGWEGVGVTPDIPAPADEAMARATALARR
ncbi:S41 family peptidase [Sphingomonas gilva]|nr:S41 family peptidase [Sphingomonas gilva]